MVEDLVVRAHPRKLRVICWSSAATIVILFTVLGIALRGKTEGGGQFEAGDQAAMVILGLLIAAGILAVARPRVEADDWGVRVKNIVGGYRLPWGIVRAVRFDDGAAWASLELADDDTVPVMAIQAADKEYAVDAVRGLRALLERYGTGVASPPSA